VKRRNWDPKTKAMIVLQGLKGKPIVDLCTEHQISQTQYYLWREQFLANMQKAFINDEHREKILLKENDRLKQAVGELHLQLKKTNEWQR
jgi:transposase-like protein